MIPALNLVAVGLAVASFTFPPPDVYGSVMAGMSFGMGIVLLAIRWR